MSTTGDDNFCKLCNKNKYKYICPKCSVPYCSVDCYKSTNHLNCSEAFYKNCIQNELSSGGAHTQEDVRKMYDILKRMRQFDAGETSLNFENDGLEEIDSDDDKHQSDSDSDEDDSNNVEEIDLATRLNNIDLNEADKVWECLTDEERLEFQKMIECGDIMKLLPNYKPWWIKRQNTKIVEISKEDEIKKFQNMPKIFENITKFSDICKKEPSPCLHYNLWNILSAYACMVRYFDGEHLTNANEAVAQLVNISSTLKYGTNFEDAEDAIISVEMEAITTGNGVTGALSKVTGATTSLVESREQLQNDAKQLMSVRNYKLAALSDMLELFKLTKATMKKSEKQAEFQKLFAVCSGSVELNRTKLQQLIKKFEFYLSYVNKEYVEDL